MYPCIGTLFTLFIYPVNPRQYNICQKLHHEQKYVANSYRLVLLHKITMANCTHASPEASSDWLVEITAVN